jgi:hypothetical protein
MKNIEGRKNSTFYTKIEKRFCVNYIKFLYNLYKIYKNKGHHIGCPFVIS